MHLRHTLIAIAFAIATLTTCATASARLSPTMAYQLAQHPQCFVTDGGTVVVRGAVAFVETREPAAGVTVVLAYGNASTRATSAGDGTYTATFAHVQPGAVVREVGIYATTTGSLLPLPHAQAFAGACRPARVGIGALQTVGGAK